MIIAVFEHEKDSSVELLQSGGKTDTPSSTDVTCCISFAHSVRVLNFTAKLEVHVRFTNAFDCLPIEVNVRVSARPTTREVVADEPKTETAAVVDELYK